MKRNGGDFEEALEQAIRAMLRSDDSLERIKAVEAGCELLAIRAKMSEPEEADGSFFKKDKHATAR